jgi:hypothetical protein
VWLTAVDFTATYEHELTQHGYACTETNQALFLARSLPFALAAGVERVFYAEVNGRVTDTAAQQWAALVTTNGHRRMAYYTLQKLAGLLNSFAVARLTTVAPSVMLAEFEGTNAAVGRIVWNNSNRVDVVSIPVGPVTQARVTTLLPHAWNDSGATWTTVTNAVTNGMAWVAVDSLPRLVEPVGVVHPDIDGDGLSNTLDPDIDGDGLVNVYETVHGLNPFEADGDADADGDGLSNLEECLAGTDPQRSDSRLVCARVSRLDEPALFKVEWQSVSGVTYRVDWSANLTGGWSNALDGVICADGPTTAWYDSGPPNTGPIPTNGAPRFYRIRVP